MMKAETESLYRPIYSIIIEFRFKYHESIWTYFYTVTALLIYTIFSAWQFFQTKALEMSMDIKGRDFAQLVKVPAFDDSTPIQNKMPLE